MLYLPSLKKKAFTNPAAIHFIMRTDVRQVTLGIRAISDYSTMNRNNVKRAYVYIYGTVSAKIAPRLKCYKNASRLNRYNFPMDNAIDFLFSTLHIEMV